jgi:hypothetical protein
MMNPEHEVPLKELHHWILLYGLGNINGEVIPYPSNEYVRRNLLSRQNNSNLYLTMSQTFEKNPALKGDKTWELLAHWYIEGLAIEGYEKNIPNPLENATVKARDLKRFIENNQYAAPHWVLNTLDTNSPTAEHAPSCTDNAEHHEYPPQLETLTLAWRRNWKNADPTDRSGCPKKDSVKAWLMDQGLSAKNADAGATIIKPQWAIDKGW